MEERQDLISRQALCEYALNQRDKSVTPNDIMRFPSAQPERKTSHWKTHIFDGIMGGRPRAYMCGYCNFISLTQTNYCPNCGAKMEVENET